LCVFLIFKYKIKKLKKKGKRKRLIVLSRNGKISFIIYHLSFIIILS
jgi:hypothetical protein